MIPVVDFHRTYTNPSLLKYLYPPLVIITTVCHAQASARYPYWKSTWTSATNFLQWTLSVSFSCVASRNHWWRCSTCMPNGPPEWIIWIPLITSATSASPGIELLMGKGYDLHWDGTAQWRDMYVECHPLCRHPLNGYPVFGGVLNESLYHPGIRIHAHLIRGGLDTRMDSMEALASAYLCRRFPCRISCIRRLRRRMDLCPLPSWQSRSSDILS